MDLDGVEMPEPPTTPEPHPKRKAASTDAETETTPTKNKPGAGTGPSKGKAQCTSCGKWWDRKLMPNQTYCKDGKQMADRLYKAAQAQGTADWLSEQLSTMESTQRIVNAYKRGRRIEPIPSASQRSIRR